MRTQAPVPVRRPFGGAALLDFLLRHTVAGVETGSVDGSGATATVRYARTLRLPHRPGVLVLRWTDGELSAEVDSDARDSALVLARVAHLVDADADPAAVDGHLGQDAHLSDLVAATPGLRVPGVLDVAEMVFRTLIGQQISLASARACGATISRRHGERVETGDPDLQFLFPGPAVLAALDPTTLPMPRARGRSLVAVAQRMVDGRLDLSDDLDPGLFRDQLLDCPGIGPWTADYVAMRARHQPDVLLGTDLIIKRELVARGITDPDAWRPYRSYATLHLWHDFLARTAR